MKRASLKSVEESRLVSESSNSNNSDSGSELPFHNNAVPLQNPCDAFNFIDKDEARLELDSAEHVKGVMFSWEQAAKVRFKMQPLLKLSNQIPQNVEVDDLKTAVKTTLCLICVQHKSARKCRIKMPKIRKKNIDRDCKKLQLATSGESSFWANVMEPMNAAVNDFCIRTAQSWHNKNTKTSNLKAFDQTLSEVLNKTMRHELTIDRTRPSDDLLAINSTKIEREEIYTDSWLYEHILRQICSSANKFHDSKPQTANKKKLHPSRVKKIDYRPIEKITHFMAPANFPPISHNSGITSSDILNSNLNGIDQYGSFGHLIGGIFGTQSNKT